MQETASLRAQNEVAHGKMLAAEGAEHIWGWGTPAGKIRARRRAELIVRMGNIKPSDHVLEIGCGTGLFTEMFATTGARIVAVDISEELLELARKRGLPSDRVRFEQKRFEDCKSEGPFDAVIGSSVLHHLEMETAVARIYELLRPGGLLCFAEPNMLNPQIFIQKNVGWVKRRLGDSPDETAIVRWRFARMLRSRGFDQVDIRPHEWLHPATPRLLVGPVRTLGALMERLPGIREFGGSVLIRARKPPHG